MSRRTHPIHGLAAALLLAGCGATESTGTRPAISDLAYVGRESCVDCHASAVERYTGSDHDRAMDHADSATVLGDFGGVTLRHGDVETRLFLRDGRYWIRTDGPTGALEEYEVLYTFGVRPLQQYLVQTEQGRLQRLPWSWDVRPEEEGGQRWFHVYGDGPIGPDDVLHWTRSSQNWNRMCADCHSTNLDEGYDPETDRYATTWSEIDVSCEACHGPASSHLAWAQAEEPGPAPENGGFPVPFEAPGQGRWARSGSDPTARRTAPPPDRLGLERCAGCHAHRTRIAESEPGARFADTYRLSLPRGPLYHADGQVREEVFVYGSFLQSKMYREGVACTDCHDPHTAGLRIEGNALCTQCHSVDVFDGPQHHRHESSGAGSACVDCHMPSTTFMAVDDRRDHGFRVPTPDIEDAPNACTSCHQGRRANWTRTTLETWYGAPQDSTRSVTARAFKAAEAGDPSAAEALHRIATDPSQNGIVRATAVSYLDRYPSMASLSIVQAAAADPDPLVRAEAAWALRMLEPDDRIAVAAPLLQDETLLVRIAAARTLAPVSRRSMPPERLARLDSASADLLGAWRLRADDPAAGVELGDHQAERGLLVEAEAEYRRAIRLEPGFVPAYLNLADLLRATGRDSEAIEVLRDGRRQAPDAPMLAYALGLAHVRGGGGPEALAAFAEAANLEPSDSRFVLAHALALDERGRPDEAVDVLEASLPRASSRRDVLLTLIHFHREAGRHDLALRRAEELVGLTPGDQGLLQLIPELRRAAGRRP